MKENNNIDNSIKSIREMASTSLSRFNGNLSQLRDNLSKTVLSTQRKSSVVIDTSFYFLTRLPIPKILLVHGKMYINCIPLIFRN